MRNPDNMEFIEDFGINNNLDPALLGFCKEKPELFHSFEQYENPDENPYIFTHAVHELLSGHHVRARSLVTYSNCATY